MKGKVFIAVMLMVLMVPFSAFAWRDLGASGDAAQGTVVKYESAALPYSDNLNPAKTAMFIIDPQLVYSVCPAEISDDDPDNDLGALIDPSPYPNGLPDHSPLCCEKYSESIANIMKIAQACEAKGIPVFLIKHVYNADGSNCGRLCDFDPLHGYGWPQAWLLWNEVIPFSALKIPAELNTITDYYTEKSIYSSFTKPVAAKLKDLHVDTVIVTGFMTQYCSVTATRHGHDLGFKMIYVQDANDGPKLLELMSGIDENLAISAYMGIPVAEVIGADALAAKINQ